MTQNKKANWIFVFPKYDLELRDKYITLYGTRYGTKDMINRVFSSRKFYQYEEKLGLEVISNSNLTEFKGEI